MNTKRLTTKLHAAERRVTTLKLAHQQAQQRTQVANKMVAELANRMVEHYSIQLKEAEQEHTKLALTLHLR